MPATQITNAGVLKFVWSLSGAPYAVNTIGFMGSAVTPVTQALADQIATDVRAAFTSSALNAQISNTVTLSAISIRSWNQPNLPEFVGAGTASVGTGGATMLPPQVALCVTLRTALAGRRFRGRTYLPGWASAANSATGTATAAVLTASVGFMNAIFTAMTTRGIPMGIVSMPAPTATPPRPTGSVQAVTAILARDAIWDTQRRRAVPGI